MADPKMVTIDGSHGEGGGQILRNAAALAVITGTPLRVHSIRAGRAPKPGLRPQHLHGLQLAARLSGFELRGGVVGSSEIMLLPPSQEKEEEKKKKEEQEAKEGAARGNRTIRVDPGTAASTLLMAQTALPCLLFLPSSSSAAEVEAGAAETAAAVAPRTTTTLELVGGTDASAAPPADYARLVLLPTLRNAFSARTPVAPSATAAAPPAPPLFDVDLRVRKRGFFPRGQGLVSLTVTPLRPGETLPPITLERRKTGRGKEEERISVEVAAFSAGDKVPEAAAGEAAEACVAALLDAGAVASREQISVAVSRLKCPEEAFGDGGGIIAVAKVEAGGGAGGEGGSGPPPPPLLLGSAQPLSPPPKGAGGGGSSSSSKRRKTTTTTTGPSSSSPSSSPYWHADRASPAEVGKQVGSDLARDLLCSSSGGGGIGGCEILSATDRWLQDQLVVFMALARGTSRVATCSPLTEHARSAIAVAEALTTARFRVVGLEAGGGGEGGKGGGGGACLIECEGAGVAAR